MQVQAVLLLLGGREVPVGMSSSMSMQSHQVKVRNLVSMGSYLSVLYQSCATIFFLHIRMQISPELPQRQNMPQRLASLTRFREKRKERNYEKKIRYSVRKEVAQRFAVVIVLCYVIYDLVLISQR
jgi:hypothetical protein